MPPQDLLPARVVARHEAQHLPAMGALQRIGRIERKHLALIDDADPVAALDLFDVMGRDKDRQLARRAQGRDVLPDPPARLGVEPDGRFVQQQDL